MSGETVTERARALLARIAALDAELRCYVAVDEAAVLRDAARLDALEPAARGALHGWALAVKDIIDVAGLPTRAGSSFFRRDPERDAPAVAALRAAGALVIGKTNTHEFAWGITTENPHFGRTANPWDRTRTVGGSSGGSAAAVAAGLADIALGSDTLGSIRIPAALNGISGVRPATGALSLDGIFPLALGLDTVGPFARDLDTVRRSTTCSPAARYRTPRAARVPAARRPLGHGRCAGDGRARCGRRRAARERHRRRRRDVVGRRARARRRRDPAARRRARARAAISRNTARNTVKTSAPVSRTRSR